MVSLDVDLLLVEVRVLLDVLDGPVGAESFVDGEPVRLDHLPADGVVTAGNYVASRVMPRGPMPVMDTVGIGPGTLARRAARLRNGTAACATSVATRRMGQRTER
jgi:hypothetical protein